MASAVLKGQEVVFYPFLPCPLHGKQMIMLKADKKMMQQQKLAFPALVWFFFRLLIDSPGHEPFAQLNNWLV